MNMFVAEQLRARWKTKGHPVGSVNRDVVINHAARSKALIPTLTGCCC
jgi:hypothetical protein